VAQAFRRPVRSAGLQACQASQLDDEPAASGAAEQLGPAQGERQHRDENLVAGLERASLLEATVRDTSMPPTSGKRRMILPAPSS
jgi:hypothetical protein